MNTDHTIINNYIDTLIKNKSITINIKPFGGEIKQITIPDNFSISDMKSKFVEKYNEYINKEITFLPGSDITVKIADREKVLYLTVKSL